MILNNRFERIVFSLCPIELNEFYLSGNVYIPSISHCVGTDKLIGQYYGEAICYDYRLEESYVEKLSLVSCLLRSYIVLDDFLKDNRINNHISLLIQKWLENIRNEINESLLIINKKTHYLWNKYIKIYEDSYNNFNANDLYTSIINKCGLIFIIFEIEEISIDQKSRMNKKIMQDFLFCLQLLDDFQDMEEDLISPKNHNIFLSPNPVHYYELIYSNRYLIHNPLFNLIIKNLSKYLDYENPIIFKYISNSINWLKDRKLIGIPETGIVFSDNIEEFEFNILNYTTLFKLNENEYDYSEIKAENIHTIIS